jgi:predicted TIM-barrel fold metal-dependent hydrolase
MLLASDYERWYRTVRAAIAKLSQAEQDRILGGTAAEAYGI